MMTYKDMTHCAFEDCPVSAKDCQRKLTKWKWSEAERMGIGMGLSCFKSRCSILKEKHPELIPEDPEKCDCSFCAKFRERMKEYEDDKT
jgi:hypothetical protein